MHLDWHGDVAVLHLGDDENRFNATSVEDWGAALDEVEAREGPTALVAVGDGKVWSNGLDLDWLLEARDPAFLPAVHRLFARVLALPMATVAALNGHTFAAGAMHSLAFDQRLMREDRGWWCLPEVDLGLPFTPGMDAIITHRLPTRTAHRAMTTAHRFTAEEALAADIVDRVLPLDELVDAAVTEAAALAAKAGPALGTIKRMLHRDVLAVLEDPAAAQAPAAGT